MQVTASKSEGVKCPRCWHFHTVKENYDGLCDRCCNTILESHPDHNNEVTTGIKISQQAQRKKYCVRADDEECPHLHCCRTV